MLLPFYKYHGTGNDFIIVDNRKGLLGRYSPTWIQRLCHRRLGIGADGFMVLQNQEGYDFEMVYHNADGSQSLCGNGSRCAVHLARHLGIIHHEAYFLTTDGPHQAAIKEDLIHVKMGDVSEIQMVQEAYWLHTGSPHYVQFVDKLAHVDVYKAGKALSNSPLFQKKGTNVNFVQLEEDGSLFVRTYERGVEDETLSCGTGVTAAALAATKKGLKSPIPIKTQGGMLQVHFTQHQHAFQDIYLIGPATRVFQGTIAIHPACFAEAVRRLHQ